MAKKNSIVTVTVDNGALVFTVAHGAGTFTLDPATLSDEIRNLAMLHGLKQKISDAAAISRDELTGDDAADAKTKFESMRAVAENLNNGEWSKRSGDGAGPVAGVIYRAFEEWAMAKAKAAKKTITPAEVRAIYDAKDRAGQLALRTVPEIATIIERMKSERGPVASKVDASALLADLGI